jgi:exodeoxyribonuclease VII large subunit
MKDPGSKLINSLFSESHVLSVSELTEKIKNALESEFFSVHVQGEISNYKNHHSGHWYFTLKDNNSQLRGVFFRQWNRLMRFEPENGLEVSIRGRLTVYQPRGEYQIMVETMEPVGVGALQLAFEQQVKRLAAEGLFNETRKRNIPWFPGRIGIVTSPVGAALKDMLQILERRNRGIDVIIAPVRVQGNGAASEIADAIRMLNDYSRRGEAKVDVIIVGRGGGSIEDLWAFNEEQVARAIFQSEIPVVSAVGHETDFTIADFVADLRAPTPSAAAEMVAPESAELKNLISSLKRSLERVLNYYLLRRRSHLRDLVESRGFTQTAGSITLLSRTVKDLEVAARDAVKSLIQSGRENLFDAHHRLGSIEFRAPIAVRIAGLAAIEERMIAAFQKSVQTRQRKLSVSAGKLDMLSPLAVLSRGYAIVRNEAGGLVVHASSVSKGQNLSIRFEDGEVPCEVK